MRAFSFVIARDQERDEARRQSRGLMCGFLDCFAHIRKMRLLCDHRRSCGRLLRLSAELEVQADGENINTTFGVGVQCQA